MMAKSLVRNRHAVNKLFQLKSQLQAVSLRIAVRACPEGGNVHMHVMRPCMCGGAGTRLQWDLGCSGLCLKASATWPSAALLLLRSQRGLDPPTLLPANPTSLARSYPGAASPPLLPTHAHSQPCCPPAALCWQAA